MRWSFDARLTTPTDRRGSALVLRARLTDRAPVTIEASARLFPHLRDLDAGTILRILDANLIDEDEHWLELSAWSEAYVVSR